MTLRDAYLELIEHYNRLAQAEPASGQRGVSCPDRPPYCASEDCGTGNPPSWPWHTSRPAGLRCAAAWQRKEGGGLPEEMRVPSTGLSTP
jgi:hypothetical protein